MELLFLDMYEIFTKKFVHFPAMLFHNRENSDESTKQIVIRWYMVK